jgi:hypothetical protein
MDIGKESGGKEKSFKAHRDVFFFTLQRELEKVSTEQHPIQNES